MPTGPADDDSNEPPWREAALDALVKHRTVVCQNSWGKQWGINGGFTLTWDQLGELLTQRGDALTLQR